MTVPAPSGFGLWATGARVKTLPAAIVPVAVGAAVAVGEGSNTPWWRAGAALVVALALQIGVNFANDYSDGVRGTDGADRVGPLRLVGSGLVSAGAVKRAATGAFALAGLVGAGLAVAVGPELLLVGGFCLVAGWTYTGGPRPYGYLGLGEVFVFVFFGVVATVGTTYVLLEEVRGLAVAASITVGLWATALMVTNNLRDIPGDTIAGKRTLAVRLGDRRTRRLFVAMHVGALLVAVAITGVTGRAAIGSLAAIPWVLSATRRVVQGATGHDLIPVLVASARAQLVGGMVLALGLAVSG